MAPPFLETLIFLSVNEESFIFVTFSLTLKFKVKSFVLTLSDKITKSITPSFSFAITISLLVIISLLFLVSLFTLSILFGTVTF